MGIDIHGWVEAKIPAGMPGAEWYAVIRLDALLWRRDYASYGLLFEVGGHLDSPPVAAERGLPSDVSTRVEEEFTAAAKPPSGVYAQSWITLSELRRIARAHTFGEDWRMVLAMMEAMTAEYSPDELRMVVWFS